MLSRGGLARPDIRRLRVDYILSQTGKAPFNHQMVKPFSLCSRVNLLFHDTKTRRYEMIPSLPGRYLAYPMCDHSRMYVSAPSTELGGISVPIRNVRSSPASGLETPPHSLHKSCTNLASPFIFIEGASNPSSLGPMSNKLPFSAPMPCDSCLAIPVV